MIVLLLLVAADLVFAGPASARGGGAANLLNSPGYQRALQESRDRYRRETQSYTQPPAAYPGKKWRHRGRRH
ncbi:MAG TPA: hypothetical protein VF467_14160 [Afipia sp.]